MQRQRATDWDLRGIFMDKKMYDYWLYGLPSIGKKTFMKLNGMGCDSFFLYKCAKNDLPDFLSKKQKDFILKGQTKSQEVLERSYEKLKKQGIFMTVFGDADYPKKLYEIPDAPAVLFYKGQKPDIFQKNIAIIGARNCSEYGKYVAERFAACFSENNVGVISGMANGIDGYSQKAAVSHGGFSVGVLGCGVNVCYPMENYGLYKELSQKGCVVSEYLPDENPVAGYFPPRNRIISGLADALVVVEAKEKSGTLITVEMALEQGKDVFVVPGRITDALSKGCNKLLWEGAIPAVEPEKVLENLYGIQREETTRNDCDGTGAVRRKILSFLDVTPVHINVLQERTGLAMEVLCKELLFLTLENSVIQVGSNWYKKA